MASRKTSDSPTETTSTEYTISSLPSNRMIKFRDIEHFFGMADGELKQLLPPELPMVRARLMSERWLRTIFLAGLEAEHGVLDKVEQRANDILAKHAKHLAQGKSQTFKPKVFERDGPNCRYCGTDVKGWNMVFDHIIPVSLGGISSLENLTVCCRPCNHEKGTLIPRQWYDKLEESLTWLGHRKTYIALTQTKLQRLKQLIDERYNNHVDESCLWKHLDPEVMLEG